ncbi:hypothetical protein GHH_c35260 [Geobacillus sp. GHH01]|nr:hypothetical protein GC56T3_3413 [Geobacillus sp. C56-T3]ADU95866.1 hypothetical protein GYMC52_3524 [Geobacillus sp. Y412MC52]AGE24015.1 hypothetical protein GHH_c35260 [Geobacillus sp. GHH01]EPR29987.1 hypothetical protein I656_00320 [Geobacillus sp. WSUCF1]OQP16460.1 hypothetical protein B1693_08180 [Geobacillus zalihae]PJW13035.1 hypothetical protein CV945_16530 [Geobacillus sp. Manikaran-105]PJW16113.1 hypothetical protein CV944_16455 [Geobacillus sp. WSUCF-018B]
MVPLFAYYRQENHNLMISCLPRRRPFHPVSGEFMVFAPVLRCWGFMYLSRKISHEEIGTLLIRLYHTAPRQRI